MFCEAWKPFWGGGQEVALSLSKELSKLNYDITLFTMNLDGKKEEIINNNFRIKRTGKLRKLNFINRILWFFDLKKTIKNEYDIFYGHSTLPGFYIKYFSKKFNKKSIFHIHELYQIRNKSKFNPLFIIQYVLSFKIKYDLELIVSKDFLSFKKNVNKPFYLKNGILEFKNFKKEIKKIKKIIFIGRLDYFKGIDILIESLNLIKDNLIEKKVKFEIYGEGDQKILLNSLIKKYSIENLIELKGEIYGDDKEKIFRKADLFIQTGRDEEFGIVFLEAIKNKTPLLVSNIGLIKGLEDNKNCFKFDSLEVKNISKKILEVLNSESRKLNAIKENAFDIARKKYTWKNIAKKLDKLIKQNYLV